jgi:hypothetical protein
MEDAEKVMRYPAKETAVKHERIVRGGFPPVPQTGI